MKALLISGSRGIGMAMTTDTMFPAPLGHMNMDFFAKAFRKLGWVVEHTAGWLSSVTEASIAEAIKQINPDVVIWPQGSLAVSEAPSSCLVIHYVNDSHSWDPGVVDYSRVDAFLSRHRQGVGHMRGLAATKGRPIYYFPFSVDLDLLPKRKWKSRADIVGFTGSADEYLYPHRVQAAQRLADADLLHDARARWQTVSKKRWHWRGQRLSQSAINHHDVAGGVKFRKYAQIDPRDYFEYLASFKIVLTCASNCQLVLNKDYEIPAAGAVVLTDGGTPGLDEILPAGSYLKYYNPDDVVRVVRRALANPQELQARARLARDHIHEYHSDVVRTTQLEGILEELR